MLDTRLYSSSTTNVVRTATEHYEVVDLVTPDTEPATDMEILGGKVVKFLLTYRGSDAFEPNYGGIALHHGQICDAYIPKLKLELLDDIDRCASYINSSESELASDDEESERLYKITLKDLVYDQRNSPTRVDAYIEILSTTGKRELVAISSEAES